MRFKSPLGLIARPNLSLRTELILLLGAIVLLATASLGSIAFNTSRTIVEEGAVRAVGVVANARKQALIRFLSDQRVRAAAVLETVSVGCAPDETICIRRILMGFAASESASAVQLAYRNRPPIIVGDDTVPFPEAATPAGDQIARFVSDQTPRYYVIQVRDVLRDGEMVITLRADIDGVNSIFNDRYGLGESGETFLTEAVSGSGAIHVVPRVARFAVVLADGSHCRSLRYGPRTLLSEVHCRSLPPNPAAPPCSPSSPRSVIVHFCGVQCLICHLLLIAKLAVFLILRFLADIEHVALRVRKSVVHFPVTLRRGDFVGRKRLEMCLRLRGIGWHHLETCRREHILFFLGRAAADRHSEESANG